MKSIKRSILESTVLFGTCILLLALYSKGLLPNISEGVTKAIPSMTLILVLGAIFIILTTYLKHREIKTNPESKEVFEIYDTDERRIYLKDKANSKAYDIFNIIEIPLCLILLFTGFDDLGVALTIFHFVKQGVRSLIHLKISKEY